MRGGKSEHQRAGYFLTGSLGDEEKAPQKTDYPNAYFGKNFLKCKFREKVKRRCKRPPVFGVNRKAGKALSGAMPNRRTGLPDQMFSGGQLKSVRNKRISVENSNIRFREIDIKLPVKQFTEFGLISSLTHI